MQQQLPRLTIAAPASGSGKTTVSVGLMAALRQTRGVRVQPFKAGPDFIDPTHHARVCGRPARNLDTWMCEDATVRSIFQEAAWGADISLIEGVMGLFDGFGADEQRGSTAYLAKLLQSPVLLVIDAAQTSSSAAAIALGFMQYDPALPLAGVIFNKVGSERHYLWLRRAVEKINIRCLGYLPRDATFGISERHLGLIPSLENAPTPDYDARLRAAIEATVDLDSIMSVARTAPPWQSEPVSLTPPPTPIKVRIAVARDAAFTFYYEENLDALRQRGAEIVSFSPLTDIGLPDADAVYLGGGFPEMFGRVLEANGSMRASIAKAAAEGLPIYAECGGFMYLCRAITDLDGHTWQMVDIVPAIAVMSDRLSLGYIEVQARRDTLLMSAGERFRGHTFHRSVLHDVAFEPSYTLRHGAHQTADGFAQGSVLASYVHAYFPGAPQLADHFVSRAVAFKKSRQAPPRGIR